jgi:hypothetical protein
VKPENNVIIGKKQHIYYNIDTITIKAIRGEGGRLLFFDPDPTGLKLEVIPSNMTVQMGFLAGEAP